MAYWIMVQRQHQFLQPGNYKNGINSGKLPITSTPQPGPSAAAGHERLLKPKRERPRYG